MTPQIAALRKPGTWVLAIVLVGFALAGVRCGDTTFPHGRISHQVVIDR